jgi:hypothetical protein
LEVIEMTEKKGFAIASLVCGLLFWLGFPGFILSILAIVFGIIQLKNIKKTPGQYGGRGMAIAGLILGIIGIVVFLVLTLVLGLLFAGSMASLS